ncbi:hypothetical protein EDC56_2508 [Sinobacterium caligoides]|uniref:Lipoprotein n=1 Tax=Sinobacterium caligoides TaxID=933926 RepID=A0A3N2DQF7_9GAMM|nr:hypothetical protein [Sinobacterium caligoides]ROS02058.1 hypothetical protein EDC56_2508 [Sinobacterium caligoides]
MYVRALLILSLTAFSGCATIGKIEKPITQPAQSSQPTQPTQLTAHADNESLRRSFVGEWVAKHANNQGGFRQVTVERVSDGRYVLTLEDYDANKRLLKTRQQFGFWGVSGGIYFTLNRAKNQHGSLTEANPSDADNDNAYQILTATFNQLVYRSLSSEKLYTFQRKQQ